MPSTPFLPVESRLGAVFSDYHGWELPKLYLPVPEEVGRGRSLGGLLDRSHWGKLRVTGKDAVEFVNHYATQNLQALAPGQGVQTAVTTWKGTMLDHVFLYREDEGLFLLTHPGRSGAIRSALEKFRLNVDVHFEDLTEQLGLAYLFGPLARAVAAKATGLAPEAAMHDPVAVTVGGSAATMVRTWPAFGAGFHFLVANAQARPVFEALAHEADAKGVLPIGQEAWEQLRVEAGIPAFGHEITPEVNPWEARLADSVSMRKGCYLGQEVIARLANYDKVQRYLTGLRYAGPSPRVGAEIRSGEQKVGVVTSVAPGLALGFVKGAFVEPGTRLEVLVGEEAVPALTETLPFWRDMVGQGIGARHGQ